MTIPQALSHAGFQAEIEGQRQVNLLFWKLKMTAIDKTHLDVACVVCPSLLEAADKYFACPDKRVFDLAEKALLHLSFWLSLKEDEKGSLRPEIREGALCIVKNCGPASEQAILSFAQKTVFARHLKSLKTDPRMRIEWYFSNLSRTLSVENPFSSYLEVGLHQFVPFDIATTCGELRSKAVVPLDGIRRGSVIFRVNSEALANLFQFTMLPVNLFLASSEYEAIVEESEIASAADLLPSSFRKDFQNTTSEADIELSEGIEGLIVSLSATSRLNPPLSLKRRGAISPKLNQDD